MGTFLTDNEKFTEFVQTQNAGFGLAPLAPGQAAPEVSASQDAQATQQVTGQKLEEQVKAEETELKDKWLYLLIFMIFAGGFVYQRIEKP